MATYQQVYLDKEAEQALHTRSHTNCKVKYI